MHVYAYDGLDFAVQKEFVLPEPPTGVQLLNGSLFVAGVTSFYVAILPTSPLFSSPSSSTLKKIPLISPLSSSSTHGTATTPNNKVILTPVSPHPPPSFAAILVTAGLQSSLYDASGNKLSLTIHWAANPTEHVTSIAVHAPYVLATVSNSPEVYVQLFLHGLRGDNATSSVRTIETTEATHQAIPIVNSTSPLVISSHVHVCPVPCKSESQKTTRQSLVLAIGDSSSSTLGNSTLMSDTRSSAILWGIAQRSFAVPAEQLLHKEEYEEAIELCRHMRDEREKKRLLARIHLAYGKSLLKHRQYEEAMLYLGTSELCTPVEILEHFSFLVPSRLLVDAANALRSGTPMQQISDKNGSMARLDSLMSSPPEEDKEKAASTLTPYLLSYRNRLAAAASDDPNDISYIQPLCALVDTALLNALLIMPDSGALLQFIQRPNEIDLENGSSSLEKFGRYAELVALYKARGRHTAAMDLLEKLSLNPESLEALPQGAAVDLKGLPGVWAAVKYLLSLHPPDFSLVSCHSKWILKKDPEAGVDMLVQLYPSIDPSAVMPLLTPFGTELAARYLDCILEEDPGQQLMYEKELGMLYLQQLLGAGPSQAVVMPAHEKLCKLILTSDHLEFDVLLRLLPSNGFWEMKARLLERLGRHLDALRIYVHKLKSHSRAEEYCDRSMSKKQGQPILENVYTILIQVLLEQEDRDRPGTYKIMDRSPEDERWKEIALMLSRKRNAIPSIQALDLLPGQIPISSTIQFLETACRGSSEEHRQTLLVSALYRARYAKAQTAKSEASSISFTVSQERACCFCNKRLGVAALVYLQDGDRLAHFSCYRRLN